MFWIGVNAYVIATIATRDTRQNQEVKERRQVAVDETVEPSISLVRYLQDPRGLFAGLITAAFIFSVAFPFGSATATASSIKDGEQTAVDVRYRSFSGSAGQVTEPNLALIGATQKAVFFYDVDGQRTIVIPQTQIVSIEVPEQD